ncbi:MAG: hypothetical protein GYA17_07835 [Chloroflexi bacterium]|nr:hypothetical protein [Anaerolineaceae bacterium]NMB88256.1 hypothetical protein [Chloroflexota bacterium]
MVIRNLRTVTSLGLFVLSLAVCLYTILPLERQKLVIPVNWTGSATSTQEAANQYLVVDLPVEMRVGEAVDLALQIRNSEPAGTDPQETRGQVFQLEAPETGENRVAEARLEISGLDFAPHSILSTPLQPGQDVTFRWKIRSSYAGQYAGKLWLFLNDYSAGTHTTQENPVLARQIQIQSRTVLGQPVPYVRWACLVGGLAAILLGWPVVWARFRRKAAPLP